MHLFAGWRASYLYGKALIRFHQQKYKEAARLLEKVCQLDPNHERNELYHSYLGRSYLALGHYDKALELMSRAYEPFCNRSHMLEDDFAKREFIEFLIAFSDVLQKVGQVERAREIACEAEEYGKEGHRGKLRSL